MIQRLTVVLHYCAESTNRICTTDVKPRNVTGKQKGNSD